MSLYVAAYDVSSSSRRRRVARELERFGTRVQRSVFEVYLEPGDVQELKRRVGPLLSALDDFELFPVATTPRRRVRWQRSPHAWEPVLVVPCQTK